MLQRLRIRLQQFEVGIVIMVGILPRRMNMAGHLPKHVISGGVGGCALFFVVGRHAANICVHAGMAMQPNVLGKRTKAPIRPKVRAPDEYRR